jgi:hypothetical protein
MLGNYWKADAHVASLNDETLEQVMQINNGTPGSEWFLLFYDDS